MTDMEVGISDSEWSQNMMSYADDFYDQNAFGYDKPHGDGELFLDNRHLAGTDDSQAGSWLSTSGRAMLAIGAYEEELVWEALDKSARRRTTSGGRRHCADRSEAETYVDERVVEAA